jgi:hypothetical protein
LHGKEGPTNKEEAGGQMIAPGTVVLESGPGATISRASGRSYKPNNRR